VATAFTKLQATITPARPTRAIALHDCAGTR
jgi:hypothetical protein